VLAVLADGGSWRTATRARRAEKTKRVEERRVVTRFSSGFFGSWTTWLQGDVLWLLSRKGPADL
jgi:hypothetical protein